MSTTPVPEYNLTLNQALDTIMNEPCFLRSEDMKPGFYVMLNPANFLVVVDGNRFNTENGSLQITKNLYNTKWKSFAVANKKNLNLE